MTTQERILSALKLLEKVTPLKGDCGRFCGAACCQSDETGKGGMLLFPGEKALYEEKTDWMELQETSAGTLLTCQGTCPRDKRPLACRIFPLAPAERNGKLEIELDVRAWPVCPLMESGIKGLFPGFVSAVRQAMEIVWEDEEGRKHIRRLTEEMDAFKSL